MLSEQFARYGIVRRPVVTSATYIEVPVSGEQDIKHTLDKIDSFLREGLVDFDFISHLNFENKDFKNAQWEWRHISQFHFSEVTIRVFYTGENTLIVEFSRENKSSAPIFSQAFHMVRPYILNTATFVSWSEFSDKTLDPARDPQNPSSGFAGAFTDARAILEPFFDVLLNCNRGAAERCSPDSMVKAVLMVSEIATAYRLDSSLYQSCINAFAQALIDGEDYALDTLQFVLIHFQALYSNRSDHRGVDSSRLSSLLNSLIVIAGKSVVSSTSLVESTTTAAAVSSGSTITEQDVGILLFGKSVQVALDMVYTIVHSTGPFVLSEQARGTLDRLSRQIQRVDSLGQRRDLVTASTKCVEALRTKDDKGK